MKGFMSRHLDLSLRKPESTSLIRGTAFNKDRIEEFFNNYVGVMEKYKFRPEQIYNLDETGITTVMRPIKVVTTRGKKQVGQVASAERGELVTFVGIINAVGGTVPPVYIVPRTRNPADYLNDTPASSLILGNKSGWMTKENFPIVLKHISQHTNCSSENRILLLIDNHQSHTSVESIKLCRDIGITLLSFPPHTTHRLQPLDVAIYGPFKSALAVAYDDWLLSHPGKVITIRNIGELSKLAYFRAFTMTNIVNAFKTTGLWPINRLVFSDDDFAASSVSNIDINVLNEIQNVEMPSTLETNSRANKENTLNDRNCLENIRPYPHTNEPRKSNKRKRESKSKIYTSTPEMAERERLEMEKK